MVPAAFGTQTGGSVLRPASYCGVFGFKPTFGAFNRNGVYPAAESLDTLGLIARSLDDIELLSAVLELRTPSPPRPLDRPPRIGLCRTPLWNAAQPETVAAIEDAAQRLDQAGARVREIVLPDQFAGLRNAAQDTIIQRWRDPVDGTICYIYLPITAAHSPPTASGYVQYGSNTIGSMSCVAAAPAAPRGAAAPPATTSRPGGGTGTPAPRTSPSSASPPAPAPTAPDAPPASR
jgi:Asp-tRNA(Asn)/Glu-tRNA(Gln) amidotransferase A subunit family amidase